MPYPIPSWLQQPAAPNPAEEYTRGLQLGAQIQQQHESMVAQSNEAQVRSQIAMQENERNFQYQQQQASIQNAIQQQDLQMRQQELAMRRQQNDIAVRNAADRFSAEQELSRRVGAGEDLGQVMMQLFPRLYRGTSGAGLGTLMNAMRRNKYEPPKITELEYGGKKFPLLMNPNTGSWTSLKGGGEGDLSQVERNQLSRLERKEAILIKYVRDNEMVAEKAPNTPMGQSVKDAQQQLKKIDRDIRFIQGGRAAGGAGVKIRATYDPSTRKLNEVDDTGELLDQLDSVDPDANANQY